MKCLRKFKWIKVRRSYLPTGKGIMLYWTRLASKAAFRKGKGFYCGHWNQVTPGMWSGGIVGLKSILGVKRRNQALQIMPEAVSGMPSVVKPPWTVSPSRRMVRPSMTTASSARSA